MIIKFWKILAQSARLQNELLLHRLTEIQNVCLTAFLFDPISFLSELKACLFFTQLALAFTPFT